MSETADAGEDVRIRVAEDTHLGGRLYAPSAGNEGVAPLVVVAPAIGVRQDLYAPFARHLAGRGMEALTFDFRGIGASLGERSVRAVDLDLRDWAEGDVRAVLEWARRRADERRGPLAYVGHSMGIPLLGLADHPRGPDALIAVAAPHAHWRMWEGWDRLRMWGYWHLLFPAAVGLMGYFPGRALGFGADLPAGVARQWARWARHPAYVVDEEGRPLRQGFRALDVPLLSVSSREDAYAPPGAVERLTAWFENARVEEWVLEGADVGVPRLGHVDFFRDPPGPALWDRWVA